MARSEKQKLKLLYLRDYLRQNTDEAHPASMQDLITYLESRGISAERKSLYTDIEALREYGMEITMKRGVGYYVAQRDFALSELKLLVDAVLSSRFLTEGQSVTLIRKLAALSSTHESELLRRQIVVSGRVKTMNEDSIVNIDLLHEAIGANRQITFRYFDWTIDGKKAFRANKYTASPYYLLWDDENYYLIAQGERHGITHYRVDKMADIQITKEPRIITDEYRKLNPAVYSGEVFGMYRGKRQRIKLRFHNSLAGVVIDRFGTESMLIPDGEDHFTLTKTISVSPNFLGWLAGLDGRAAILFPQSAAEQYRRFCQRALDAMDDLKVPEP